jgi:diguanylate cyclase (GGDEF)-like protein
LSSIGTSEVPARVFTRVRRPDDMVEATRWLFALLVLVTLLLAAPPSLTSGNATTRLLATASLLALALSTGAGYVWRSAPLATDLLDTAAILALASASPSPSVSVAFIFASIWFRSLYGSTRRSVLRCSLYAVALVVSLPVWPTVHGSAVNAEIGPVFGVVPTMFLTLIVARHLAGILLARQRTAQRDAVQLAVGVQLLGATDADEIRRIAWTAMAGICAATPGLRVLKIFRDGAVLRVDGAAGGFASVPATISGDVVKAVGDEPGTARANVRDHAELDAAVGAPCAWTCVPLPNGHSQHRIAWLILGAPRQVPDEAMVAIGGVANQVTLALQNSAIHRELTVQAALDNLTGLANRPAFKLALGIALDDGARQPTTVLFVDIDDFKDVNDQLGHGSGDELLREIAARLRRATRPDDLCARLGGDEFAVLLRGTDSASAADVARRIVTAVAVPAHLGRGTAQVGASVGVATGTSGSDLEQLIHRADIAMYAAKANGKARIQLFEAGLLRGDLSQVTF